jgi:hypothetical protein
MNIDKIVDRLRETGWHIDDDGEKELRKVLSDEGVTSDEAKIGAARYEYIRKLNPRQFSDLFRHCLFSGEPFDGEVDRRRRF